MKRNGWMSGALFVLGLAAVGLASVAIYFSLQHIRPSPLSWDRSVYSTDPTGPACPGDVLSYTTLFTVTTDRRILIGRHEAWTVASNGRQAVSRTGEALTGDIRRTPFDRTTSFTTTFRLAVPDLAPGDYVYKVSGVADYSQFAGYDVPVTVRADCP